MSKENDKELTAESVEEMPESEATGEDMVDTATVEDLASRLEALAVERDRLAAQNQELQDRLLRSRAEFENFRRRTANERAEFAAYAAMEAVRELLPILDDFERASQAVPEELGLDSEYVKGIQMIYQRLRNTLAKLGLEPIESVGKPFDPNFHHAVERVPTSEAEDHSVLEEWQKGYNFKGKLLREAMVKVAVRPAEDAAGEESDSPPADQ